MNTQSTTQSKVFSRTSTSTSQRGKRHQWALFIQLNTKLITKMTLFFLIIASHRRRRYSSFFHQSQKQPSVRSLFLAWFWFSVISFFVWNVIQSTRTHTLWKFHSCHWLNSLFIHPKVMKIIPHIHEIARREKWRSDLSTWDFRFSLHSLSHSSHSTKFDIHSFSFYEIEISRRHCRRLVVDRNFLLIHDDEKFFPPLLPSSHPNTNYTFQNFSFYNTSSKQEEKIVFASIQYSLHLQWSPGCMRDLKFKYQNAICSIVHSFRIRWDEQGGE